MFYVCVQQIHMHIIILCIYTIYTLLYCVCYCVYVQYTHVCYCVCAQYTNVCYYVSMYNIHMHVVCMYNIHTFLYVCVQYTKVCYYTCVYNIHMYVIVCVCVRYTYACYCMLILLFSHFFLAWRGVVSWSLGWPLTHYAMTVNLNWSLPALLHKLRLRCTTKAILRFSF